MSASKKTNGGYRVMMFVFCGLISCRGCCALFGALCGVREALRSTHEDRIRGAQAALLPRLYRQPLPVRAQASDLAPARRIGAQPPARHPVLAGGALHGAA